MASSSSSLSKPAKLALLRTRLGIPSGPASTPTPAESAILELFRGFALADPFLKKLGIDAEDEVYEFDEVFGGGPVEKMDATDGGVATEAGRAAGTGLGLLAEVRTAERAGFIAWVEELERGRSATGGLTAASASPAQNLAQGNQKGKGGDNRVFLNRARALQTSLDEDMVVPTRELEKKLRKHVGVDFEGMVAILEGLVKWRNDGKEVGVLGKMVLRALEMRGGMEQEGNGEDENDEMRGEWEEDGDEEEEIDEMRGDWEGEGDRDEENAEVEEEGAEQKGEEWEDWEEWKDDKGRGTGLHEFCRADTHPTSTLPARSTTHMSTARNAAPRLPTKLNHYPNLWHRVQGEVDLGELQKQLYTHLCLREEMRQVFGDMTRKLKHIGYWKRATQAGEQRMERNMKNVARTGMTRIRELVQMKLPS